MKLYNFDKNIVNYKDYKDLIENHTVKVYSHQYHPAPFFASYLIDDKKIKLIICFWIREKDYEGLCYAFSDKELKLIQDSGYNWQDNELTLADYIYHQDILGETLKPEWEKHW